MGATDTEDHTFETGALLSRLQLSTFTFPSVQNPVQEEIPTPSTEAGSSHYLHSRVLLTYATGDCRGAVSCCRSLSPYTVGSTPVRTRSFHVWICFVSR